jgi:hypothetical protein
LLKLLCQKIGVGLIRKECSSPIKYDDDEQKRRYPI